ncbi:DMT family transporter [Mesorhizobium sp. Z1-4]|uniref:DMT family transporter n=1 Tax=Mesorhizobium sp. Z1-4 TaxID=2448478 RepID=UPI000FDC966E|nr:DMT family transporter [Mesorhizobium sp. Z1-4]
MIPRTDHTESPTPLLAIGLIVLASVIFSAFDASAKYVALAGVAPLFMAWVRYAVHVVAVVLFFRAWSNPGVFRPNSYLMQLLRAFCLFGATVFTFFAVRTLQLAEMISIFFAAPVFITALAGPLLGEWAGWRRWLAVAVGFAGVLIVVRPSIGTISVGHLFAFACTLSYSFYAILTRRLSATESAQSMIFFSGVAPVVLLLPVVPYHAALPDDPVVTIVLLMLGILGATSHLLLIQANRLARATVLAPFSYLQMVWAIILGWLVFAELPDIWVLIGAAVIVASGVYIARREHKLGVNADARASTRS